MNGAVATACALLRHEVRPRFIGDLVAAYCHSCSCLYVPEPVTTTREDAPLGARVAGRTPPLIGPSSLPVALATHAGHVTG